MASTSDAFWVAGGRIANAVLLLVALRVMTTILTPADYGLLAILATFQAFAGLILINPPGQWLNRHTHAWQEDGSVDLRLRVYARYWLASATVTGALVFGWFVATRPAGSIVEGVAIATGVAAAIQVTTAQGTAIGRANMLGHRRESAIWQLVATGTGLAASAVLVLAWPSALAWLLGQVIGAWLGFRGVTTVLKRHSKPKVPIAGIPFREPGFLRFCLPLGLMTSLLWVEANGYRLLLEPVWGLAQLGLFALALSVPAQMSALFESIVMQYFYPHFYRALSSDDSAQKRTSIVGAMINLLLPLYLIWGAFLLLTAPHLLRLLTDARYHEAAAWVIVGVAVEIARTVSNVWQLVAHAEKNFVAAIAPFAVGAVGTLAAATAALWLGLGPGQFGAFLIAALYTKMLLLIAVMRARINFSLDIRRATLAGIAPLGALLAFESLARPIGLLPSAGLVSVVALVTAALIVLHLRSSPAVPFILSHQLKENA